MKTDKYLLKVYRRNPDEFKKQFKKLREEGADKECIKCNVISGYLPKVSKNIVYGGIGAIILSSAIKGINHLLGGDPNIDSYCEIINITGLLAILGSGTTGPIESIIRRRIGPRIKPIKIVQEVGEFSNLTHIVNAVEDIEESLNPFSEHRNNSNPYNYVNISLEDKNNPYRLQR